MNTYIAPPYMLNGSTEQQISDIYTYLFRLSQTLNLEFEKTTPAAIFEEVNKALAGADTEEPNKAIADNYQQLKALVIKTADYTASTGNSNVEEYYGTFVAKSEFGEYKEETNAAITTNSTGIEQMYEYSASLGILGNGESDVDITQIETWTQAYIKSGLIYYDQSTPKYGIAVGNVGTLVTVGDEKVVNLQNLLATFTADEMAFWKGGNKIAYLSGTSMHFPSAEITGGSININNAFTVTSAGVMNATGATVSGTVTATAGAIGNWTIGTALYNGKTSLSDTSHSGTYIGTDGFYIGDGAGTSEKYIKLLPSGKLTANDADISGTLTAGNGSKIGSWTVGETTGSNPVSYIYSGSRTSYSSTASGIYIGTDGISMGSPTSTLSGAVGVQISSTGALTCRGATINGALTATSLTINSGASVSGLSVTSTMIANGAITTNKLDAQAVTAAKIMTGTITATQIAANTITGSEIAANTITSNHLSVGSISADKIGAGTISTSGSVYVGGYLGIKNGSTSAGVLGYYSGFNGKDSTTGIGMKTSSGGEVACSTYGAHMRFQGGKYGEVWVVEGGVGFRVKNGTSETSIQYDYVDGDNQYAFHPMSNSTGSTVGLPLGSASYKWRELYAGTGTINTSDRREKHDISYNIDNYEALFDELKPAKFKFNDGTSNRFHTGFISQDVEDSLALVGMTSLDFAGFIKSPHYTDGQIDDYHYGLRYEEIIALAVLKIKKLETRIAALEGA